MNPHCQIAVMGAGAVGCYYGGMLARAGYAVTLIARPHHVDAIVRDGLRLQAHGFDERIRLNAVSTPDGVRGADVVLLCVKSTDTESAALAMQPYLAADAVIFTFQNGVDNADRLRAVLSQQVAATVVYVASEMAGVGHVKHNGRGELVLEPSAATSALARMFAAAGVPVDVSDHVRGALWTKLVLNCAWNALSAIARMPYRELSRGAGVSEVIRDVVAECKAVASADGVSLPADMDAAVDRIPQTMPGQLSSTAQDLGRSKRSEIDHLNGYVVRRGEALGVPVPVNRVLQTLVKLIEARPH